MAKRIDPVSPVGISVHASQGWTPRADPFTFWQWVSGGHIPSDAQLHWPVLSAAPILAGAIFGSNGYLPQVAEHAVGSGFAFARGAELLCGVNATIPDVCYRCDQPATRTKRKKLTEQKLINLVGLIFGVVGLLIMQLINPPKTVRLNLGQCARHDAIRKRRTAVGLGLIMLALLAVVIGAELESGIGFVAIPLAIASPFVAKQSKLPRVQSRGKTITAVTGLSPALLARMPPVANR